MLDAYIIERIRRERDAERNEGAFVPLRIEVPRPERDPPPIGPEEKGPNDERGSIIIDFNL